MSGHDRRTFLKLSAALVAGIPLRARAGFGKPVFVERAAFTMGSIATVKAYAEDDRRCNRAIDRVFADMKEIDALMSVFNARSQVSLVNSEAGRREVSVDPRLIGTLIEAERASRGSYGAFDITVEPLMSLYGFRSERPPEHLPTGPEIARALEGIGMKNVIVDELRGTVSFASPHTAIDLGGIAVGFALDRAAAMLREEGVESALVNHSGDLIAIGHPPGEEAWEIGITDPGNPEGIITAVTIRDEALSTSGNYENFMTADNRTVGHLLDPATGASAESILSATVIARRAVEADAWSTGLFVASPASGKCTPPAGMRLIAVDRRERVVTSG